MHCFSRAFWLVGTTKVYSGVGADIVMESSEAEWDMSKWKTEHPFIDRGAEFYESQHRKLQINYLKRKAANLGFQIIEAPAA